MLPLHGCSRRQQEQRDYADDDRGGEQNEGQLLYIYEYLSKECIVWDKSRFGGHVLKQINWKLLASFHLLELTFKKHPSLYRARSIPVYSLVYFFSSVSISRPPYMTRMIVATAFFPVRNIQHTVVIDGYDAQTAAMPRLILASAERILSACPFTSGSIRAYQSADFVNLMIAPFDRYFLRLCYTL